MVSSSILLLIAGLYLSSASTISAQGATFGPNNQFNNNGFQGGFQGGNPNELAVQRAQNSAFLVFDPPTMKITDYSLGGLVKVRLSAPPRNPTTIYYEAPSLAFTSCSVQFDQNNWNEWQEVKTVALPYLTAADTARDFKMKFTASCPGNPLHGQVMDYSVSRGPGTGATCTSNGDPHYHTFDGKSYDFMGIGCYQLVRAGYLTIQTVTTQWGNSAASVNKAIAIRYGKAVWIIDAVNGKSCDDGGDDISTVKLIESQNNRDFHFQFPEGSEVKVTIQDGSPKYLDVTVIASGLLYKKTRGLCGNFDGDQDEFIGPNGESFPDSTRFGEAWKCPERDNLFQCGSRCVGALDYLLEPCNQCKTPSNLLGSGVYRDIPTGYAPSRQWPPYQPVDMPTIQALPPKPVCPDNFMSDAETKCKAALNFPGANNLIQLNAYIQNCIRDAGLTCSLAFVDGLKTSCMNELSSITKSMKFDVVEPGKVAAGGSIARKLGLGSNVCPNRCSGNGQCMSCGCKCRPGYSGIACEIPLGSAYDGVRPVGFSSRGNPFTTQNGQFNGNQFNQQGFNGNQFGQQRFNGNQFSQQGFNGNQFNQQRFNNNRFSQQGFNGNQFGQQGFNGNQFNQQGFNGNQFSQQGFNGNQFGQQGGFDGDQDFGGQFNQGMNGPQWS
jgi:hypothetical protein